MHWGALDLFRYDAFYFNLKVFVKKLRIVFNLIANCIRFSLYIRFFIPDVIIFCNISTEAEAHIFYSSKVYDFTFYSIRLWMVHFFSEFNLMCKNRVFWGNSLFWEGSFQESNTLGKRLMGRYDVTSIRGLLSFGS